MKHLRYTGLMGFFVFLMLAVLPAHSEGTTSSLRGRVVDYRQDPVAGAQIWVSRDREVHTTTTNAQGKFIVSDLPPGKIEIVAYKEGLSFAGKQGQFLGDEVATLMLDKAKDLPLRIIDQRYHTVEGARLKTLGIGHTVSINAEDLVEHGFPSFRSDEHGILLLPGMPHFGVISVTVTHPDYADSNLPFFPVGSGVDLVMTDGIKLRGRITNAEGNGVARTRVTLFKSSRGQNQKYTEVLTDRDGFYTLNAPPARYFVAAHHAQYAVPTPQAVWLRASDTEVMADLRLLPAHFIHGKALSDSGEPVPLMTIAYRKENGAIYAKATSGRDGTYTLTVPSGTGTLIVTPPTRMMTQTAPEFPITIEETIDTHLEAIVLRPLPEITGRVLDTQGNPVAQAFVRTRNASPPILSQTDEAGHFQIQLEAMEYTEVSLYAEHPKRFSRQATPVDLRNLNALEIVLKPFKPKLGFMPELSLNNLSALLDEPAPPWTCQDWFNLPEEKTTLTLDDYKGKMIVLTLWAAFDFNGSTQQRIDELNYLHSIYKDRDDIAFLSIHDAGLKPYEIELVVRDKKIEYPVGCDTESFDTFLAYRVNQIPQTLLIDPQGKVKYYEVNLRLHTLIKAMLRKR